MVNTGFVTVSEKDARFLAELQRQWDVTKKPVTARAMQESFPEMSVAEVAKKLELLSRQQHCSKGAPSVLDKMRLQGGLPPVSNMSQFDPNIPPNATPVDPRQFLPGQQHENFQEEHNQQATRVNGLRYTPEKIIHTDLKGQKHIYTWDGHSYINVSDFQVGHHVRLHGFNAESLLKFNGQLAMVVRTREENPNGKYTVVCELVDKKDGHSDKIPLDVTDENLAPPWTGDTADDMAKRVEDPWHELTGFLEAIPDAVPSTRIINGDVPQIEGQPFSRPWDFGWKFYMSEEDFDKYRANRHAAQAQMNQENLNMQNYYNMQHMGQQLPQERGDAVDEGLEYIASFFGMGESSQEEYHDADDGGFNGGFSSAEQHDPETETPEQNLLQVPSTAEAAKWFTDLLEGEQSQPSQQATVSDQESKSKMAASSSMQPAYGSEQRPEHTQDTS